MEPSLCSTASLWGGFNSSKYVGMRQGTKRGGWCGEVGGNKCVDGDQIFLNNMIDHSLPSNITKELLIKGKNYFMF